MSPLLEFLKANHRQHLEKSLGPDGMIGAKPITDAPEDAFFYRVEALDFSRVLSFWWGVNGSAQRYCALIAGE